MEEKFLEKKDVKKLIRRKIYKRGLIVSDVLIINQDIVFI